MHKYKLRNTMLDMLLRIEKEGGFSHVLIDHAIKSEKFSTKDASLLTEVVYGTLQRKMTLAYYVSPFIHAKKEIEPWVRMLLYMSLYQMIYLDRVPHHAIIHEAVEIGKQRGHKGIAAFINGVLRNVQRKGLPDLTEMTDDVKRLSIETSHPEWLINRWIKQYGYEATKAMCQANLDSKPISIRVQPLKISVEEAIEQLEREGFKVRKSKFSNQGIIVEKGNILHATLFKQGYLTIQDQSSMLVGEMLDLQPGLHVLDTCSAPGGKVTHLAEKMQNEGKIFAHDLHKKKIQLIERKADQLDLTIINASSFDARELHNVYEEESFDRILVDAPCSGLGVIRGKPDIKYHKQEKDITRLAIIQAEILDRVAPLLKISGLMIYSTCTVDKHENEGVIKKFLHRHKNYSIDDRFFTSLPPFLQKSLGITPYGLQLFPQTYGTDGFFLTRLIRKS